MFLDTFSLFMPPFGTGSSFSPQQFQLDQQRERERFEALFGTKADHMPHIKTVAEKISSLNLDAIVTRLNGEGGKPATHVLYVDTGYNPRSVVSNIKPTHDDMKKVLQYARWRANATLQLMLNPYNKDSALMVAANQHGLSITPVFLKGDNDGALTLEIGRKRVSANYDHVEVNPATVEPIRTYLPAGNWFTAVQNALTKQ